jgi:hypothetical protein
MSKVTKVIEVEIHDIDPTSWWDVHHSPLCLKDLHHRPYGCRLPLQNGSTPSFKMDENWLNLYVHDGIVGVADPHSMAGPVLEAAKLEIEMVSIDRQAVAQNQ